MAEITVDQAEITTVLAEAGARFAALVRSLSPAEMALQVPWMEWTVGDVAAHLVTIVRRTYADLERSATPDETARLNARGLREIERRDPQWIADQITTGLDIALRRVWPKIPDGTLVPFHAGTMVSIPGAAGVVLGEFLMHGFDISTPLGRPWPLPRREVALALRGLSEVLHGWVAPVAAGLTETFEIHLAGEPEPMLFSFEGGKLRISSGAHPAPDYVLETEPAAFALTVPYKRMPAVAPGLAQLANLFVSA